MTRTRPLLYERLSWPEVREVAKEDRVCLTPAGTLEDHGPHLPLDTDVRIASEISRRAAEVAPDEMVLLPPIVHGYSPHHMDFPGPITITWDTFVGYCADIGISLARHGFRRMLFYNGHGSNQNLIETAARLVMLEHPDVLAAAAFVLSSPEAHKAVDERSYPAGEHAWMDWTDGPLKLMPWWSSFSRTGVQGDATKATAEKGKAWVDTAVSECLSYVRELRSAPLPSRQKPVERPS